MTTDTDNDMTTDDEVLRERGMTDGKTKTNGITLRPMTALSLSWLQRNRVFDDESGDMMQKTAAYAYLHSEPKEEIRSVVNDRDRFLAAVDEWIDTHCQHHTELEPLSAEMNTAMETYMAAVTVSANPSPQELSGPKN